MRKAKKPHKPARARGFYDEQAKERMLKGKKADPVENLPQGNTNKSRDAVGKAFGVSGKPPKPPRALITAQRETNAALLKQSRRWVEFWKRDVELRSRPLNFSWCPSCKVITQGRFCADCGTKVAEFYEEKKRGGK